MLGTAMAVFGQDTEQIGLGLAHGTTISTAPLSPSIEIADMGPMPQMGQPPPAAAGTSSSRKGPSHTQAKAASPQQQNHLELAQTMPEQATAWHKKVPCSALAV